METQPLPSALALAQRIALCVERAGGKRAMADRCLMSESQIYRYLSGENSPTADRLLAMAKVAEVDPAWLLTGSGTPEAAVATADPQPLFRPDLLEMATRALEELLVEYEKVFTLEKRARLIRFVYEALRWEEHVNGRLFNPAKADIVGMMKYLGQETFDEILETHEQAYTHLMLGRPLPEHVEKEYWYQQFANAVQVGTTNWYTSIAGEQYYRRIGAEIVPRAAERLMRFVTFAKQHFSGKAIRWLDLGCGNGRELAFLFRHVPGIVGTGMDSSFYGIQQARQLLTGQNALTAQPLHADMRGIPFPSAQFDVVYARMSLHTLPLLHDPSLGLDRVFAESARVLGDNGLFYVHTRHGHGAEILPFEQLLNRDDIDALAARHGFDVASYEEHAPAEHMPQNKYEYVLTAILKKRD